MHALRGIFQYHGATDLLSENMYNMKIIQHIYTTRQYNTQIEN